MIARHSRAGGNPSPSKEDGRNLEMGSRLQPLAEVYPERLQGSRRAGMTVWGGQLNIPPTHQRPRQRSRRFNHTAQDSVSMDQALSTPNTKVKLRRTWLK
jgi:hypothetical protein